MFPPPPARNNLENYKSCLKFILDTGDCAPSNKINLYRNEETERYVASLSPDPTGWIFNELGSHAEWKIDPTASIDYFKKSKESGNVFGTIHWIMMTNKDFDQRYKEIERAFPGSTSWTHTHWYVERALANIFDLLGATLPSLIYHLRVSQKGDSNSTNQIGCFCFRRNRYRDAFVWFSKATNGAISSAFANLGHCYEVGIGCHANIQKALDLYKEGSMLNNAIATYRLSLMYLGEIGSVKKDLELGIRYLRKAVKLGHDEAASVLAQNQSYSVISHYMEKQEILEKLLVFKHFDIHSILFHEISSFLIERVVES